MADYKPMVVHVRDVILTDEESYVFVGRPSKWGNPFVIGHDGRRVDVIRKYENWIQTQPELLDSLHELKGKHLVCFCAPKPCHADVLLKMANDL